MISLFSNLIYAGPPFNTDDPEPVDYKHLEYLISSMSVFQRNFYTGTLPHFEANYGVIPNVQLHIIMPLNYNFINSKIFQYGYNNTEVGVKYRFIEESDNIPQIGIYPIFELPTTYNSEFNNNKTEFYIPLWVQKSWNNFTTYGGTGYWFNPGKNNKNWSFSGWELQYKFSGFLTLGGEMCYRTAPVTDSKSALAFNIGGFLNFTSTFHIIFSFGRSITGDNFLSSYVGLWWTI